MAAVSDRLEELKEELSAHPAYDQLGYMLEDDYLEIVVTRLKNGKVRTFEYSLNKLENILENLSSYDFYGAFRDMPEHLLQRPFFYIAGKDNEGRFILVYDWERLQPEDWQDPWQFLVPLWTATFMGVLQNSSYPQVVLVSLGHKFSVPVKLIPTALRLLRQFSRSALEAFPDRAFLSFQFPNKRAIPILQFVRRFVPANTSRKMVVGTHEEVRERLSEICDSFEDVLPAELGGNTISEEQHLEFVVGIDGSLETRILPKEESTGHVVVFESDLEVEEGMHESVEKVKVVEEEGGKIAPEARNKQADKDKTKEKKDNGRGRHWLLSYFSGESTGSIVTDGGKENENEVGEAADDEEMQGPKEQGGLDEKEDKEEKEELPEDTETESDGDSDFEELESIVGSFRVGGGKIQAQDVLSGGIVLEARRVVFEAGSKKKRKRILKNVDARFTSNELTAIMGPSGAGKSSLLNVLTGSKKLAQGEVLLNGIRVRRNMRGNYAFIPQENVLFPGLTPRQSLHYAARLLKPEWMTHEEREKHVDALLGRLQLLKCADTVVGSASKRGISGGERKRTSIALDLIASPMILFVDEPTSGLDSKMAKDVVEILKEVSREERLVVVVIHQPSYEVFRKFDSVLLLKEGSVLFTGKTSEFVEYFSQFEWGRVSLEGNPIDSIFEEIQDNSLAPILRAWNASPLQKELFRNRHRSLAKHLTLPPAEQKNSAWAQFSVLFSRTLYDTIGDPDKTRKRFVKKVLIGLVVGLVFLAAFDRTNSSAFVSTSALFVIMFSTMVENMLNGFAQYALLFPIVVREYRNGAFMVWTYVLAQMLCTVLTDILFTMPSLIPYFMIGFDPVNVGAFLAILCLLASFGSVSGLVIGASSTDVRDATRYVNVVMLPQVMFSGFLIPLELIPGYLSWLYYVSFLQYALNAALVNEFEEVDFTDCPPLNTTGCFQCFPTGLDYIKSYGINGGIVGVNILVMSGFVVVIILGALLMISRKIVLLSRQL